MDILVNQGGIDLLLAFDEIRFLGKQVVMYLFSSRDIMWQLFFRHLFTLQDYGNIVSPNTYHSIGFERNL